MKNEKVRMCLMKYRMKQYELASILGISEWKMCRILREELPEETQEKYCRMIEEEAKKR